MFRRYSQRFWKRKKTTGGRQGLFGGEILPMQKVKNLSSKIKSREKNEQDSFDQAFEAELAKL